MYEIVQPFYYTVTVSCKTRCHLLGLLNQLLLLVGVPCYLLVDVLFWDVQTPLYSRPPFNALQPCLQVWHAVNLYACESNTALLTQVLVWLPMSLHPQGPC